MLIKVTSHERFLSLSFYSVFISFLFFFTIEGTRAQWPFVIFYSVLLSVQFQKSLRSSAIFPLKISNTCTWWHRSYRFLFQRPPHPIRLWFYVFALRRPLLLSNYIIWRLFHDRQFLNEFECLFHQLKINFNKKEF